MGRITAYDQNGHMFADFDKSGYDKSGYDLIWMRQGYMDDIERLMADNAKLRELVADMLGYYAMPNNIDYKREAALLEEARELGIEVYE